MKCLFCRRTLKRKIYRWLEHGKKRVQKENDKHLIRRKFCNPNCKSKWMSKEWMGEKHPSKIFQAFVYYFKEELDIKPRKTFVYSTRYGLPVIPYNQLLRIELENALKYGIKQKRLRLVKRGYKQPSQYVLL